MAWLGTAPRACGARDALCEQGAAWMLCRAQHRAARGFFSLSARKAQPRAVLEPGTHHPAAESPSLTWLCWICPRGPGLAAPVPAHHTQPSADLLSPGAQQHRTQHFPLLLHNPSSSGVRQSRSFPCRDFSGSGQPDAKTLPAFFAGVAPERRGGGGGKCTRAKISVKA